MNGLEILYASLGVLVVTYPGQTASPEAISSATDALNNMIAEWNAQGPAIFSIIRTTFALTNGVNSYTIGSGATFNTSPNNRPEKIEAWRVIDASGAANGGNPVDAKTFTTNADDDQLTSALVKMLNYDAAYPVGTIRLFPRPSGGTLELWLWEQLAVIDCTGAGPGAADLVLPPGYLKAIIYNLAIDLAPIFGRQLDPTVKLVADQTKAAIGGTNMSEMTRVPPKQ